jgi:uncharacterized protein YlxW (UPF0749 family)
MESELKQYMANVDEIITLLKQEVERIENERNALQARCDRYEKALNKIKGSFVPTNKHEANIWISAARATANEALSGEGERPEGWPHVCDVCGKQNCESDHK